ncbi:MAG: YicC family protein [Desulfobacterales bacterium]|nr:YicC family protein [Desulfobacterales bacterium]
MIKSMTAFAKASKTVETLTADVTIRSYNSRHLDFSIYLPDACQVLEEEIKKTVSRFHNRGRMEIRLSILDESKELDQFEVDEIKAQSYYKALTQVNDVLKLEVPPTLDQVLAARGVILPAKKELDAELLKTAVLGVVEDAARELDAMRRREGENLYTDLDGRMDFIGGSLKDVEEQAAEIPKIYKKRLKERLAVLTADADGPESMGFDPMRLAQEVAMLADKSDVSEEITRIHSHIQLFREVMDAEESQGRKMNFLIQEFNREFNTIGSKAGNAVLSHLVVDLKSELEKIREQVQNIE